MEIQLDEAETWGGSSGCCCCVVAKSAQLFVTPWTVDPQAPLSMGFSRQEYWSGLPFPPPGNHPNPGIKPPAFQADSLPLSHLGQVDSQNTKLEVC